MDIYQRAYIGGGFKMNLLKSYFNVNNFFYVSVGGEYKTAKYTDIDSLSTNIGVFSGLTELGLLLHPTEAFGTTFSLGWSTTNFKEIKNVYDQRWASITSVKLNFFWSPKENEKYFFNIEYHTDLNSRDNFAIFQVGYKADFTKIFQSAEK
ncbi:MAG: hypothetical protein COB15_05530 [Flavobacteriales bacterium]|nr:MAG: hypothetical protein COB15_05530 [Flavobacteriales bacterium]